MTYVEIVKDNYGLSDINFENIVASDAVTAYEYTETGVSKLLDFVPLFYDNELIAWVMVSTTEDEPFYQFTTAFVDEASDLISSGAEVAFVYAFDGCYLYNGVNAYLLCEITEEIENRSSFSSVNDLASCDIVLTSVENTYMLTDNAGVSPAYTVVPTESYVLNVGGMFAKE